MKSRHLSTLIAALFSAGASLTAQAQTQPQPGKEPQPESITVTATKDAALNLDATSETASRLSIPLRELPASADVLDQSQLQARGAKLMFEALNSMAGMTASFRPGSSVAMQGRGFAENAFGILYDGIRVASTNAAMRTYDSFAFDRIEVLRGAAGLTHGEGSIGGAINHVRKQPSRVAQPIDVLAGFGNNRALRIGAGTGGPITDSLSGRIDAVRNQFDTDVKSNEHAYSHVVGSLRADLSPTLAMTFTIDALKNSIDDVYWGTPLIAGRLDESLLDINYNNLPDNVHDDDVTWLSWKTEWKAGSATVLNTAWHYQADRDWKNAYRFQYVPGTPNQVRRQWFEDLAYDHEFFGDRLEARWAGKWGGLDVKSAVGFEYGLTNFLSPRGATTGTSQLVDPFDPPPTSFFTGNNAGRNRTVSVDQTQTSVFAETQIKFSQALSVVAGLRHDRLDFDYEDRRPTSFAAFNKSFRPTTGRLGLVVEVMPGASAYVQMATGTESRFTAFFLSASDIPFDLTRARQVEAGWKQQFAGGKGEWTAAVYRIEKDRIPFADAATGITTAVGKQSSRGIEFSAALRPMPGWLIEGNAAFVDAQYDTFASGGVSFAGKTPPNVPVRVANLGVTWTATSQLSIGGWLRHVGKFFANDANTIELPAASVADVYAIWKFGRDTDVTLRAKNITDRAYASWATDANYVLVAPRRGFDLTFRGRF
ncbi:MAG: TonB-dependent receptor [Betaproteobacteria bacterium]|nr:TonB-dependent receptor [Betaproteobacteria bacterium]